MGNVLYKNIKETVKNVLYVMKNNSVNAVFLLNLCRIREFFHLTLKCYNEILRKIFEDEEIMNIYGQIIRVLWQFGRVHLSYTTGVD